MGLAQNKENRLEYRGVDGMGEHKATGNDSGSLLAAGFNEKVRPAQTVNIAYLCAVTPNVRMEYRDPGKTHPYSTPIILVFSRERLNCWFLGILNTWLQLIQYIEYQGVNIPGKLQAVSERSNNISDHKAIGSLHESLDTPAQNLDVVLLGKEPLLREMRRSFSLKAKELANIDNYRISGDERYGSPALGRGSR